MFYKNVTLEILPSKKEMLAEKRLLEDLNELTKQLESDGLWLD